MHGLHDNQKKILDHLLERPEGATLDELADHLGLSKTAAKEHLLKLDALGYVSHSDTRSGVGRPRRRYLLSEEGHDVFPKQYSWLSNVLLELLAEDLGPQAVSRIMADLAEKVAASMEDRFARATNTAERLALVTTVLNELGYRSVLKQSDLRKGAVLEATNCVYHAVAKRHPILCGFDIKFLEKATGGLQVTLESCIARGGSVCRFCMKKPAGPRSGGRQT